MAARESSSEPSIWGSQANAGAGMCRAATGVQSPRCRLSSQTFARGDPYNAATDRHRINVPGYKSLYTNRGGTAAQRLLGMLGLGSKNVFGKTLEFYLDRGKLREVYHNVLKTRPPRLGDGDPVCKKRTLGAMASLQTILRSYLERVITASDDLVGGHSGLRAGSGSLSASGATGAAGVHGAYDGNGKSGKIGGSGGWEATQGREGVEASPLQMQRSVLILDADTLRIVSTVMSQRDVLRLGVALVMRIEDDDGDGFTTGGASSSASLPHLYSTLTAIYFIRPTKSNIRRLRQELKSPRFGRYRIYSSHVIRDLRLQDLAEGDVLERVDVVQEVYGDYVGLDKWHFVMGGDDGRGCFGGDFGVMGEMVDRYVFWVVVVALVDHGIYSIYGFSIAMNVTARCTECIASVMLSLRRGFRVRYSAGSDVAARVARSLCQLTGVEQRELFDFGDRERDGANNSTVLVLDRREDPVTPLLSQWTYQAMVHELLGGMRDNVVNLGPGGVGGVNGVGSSGKGFSNQEFVLSALDDEFFRKNMYLNFGDVGMAVKELVDRVSAGHQTVKGFDTIEDIAAFVEHLPEATEQQGLTAKHVAIMGALSKEVEDRSLMAVSGVEQDVCCQASSPGSHYEAVMCIVRDAKVRATDKARLVLLFAFRYEEEAPGEVSSLFSAMESVSGVDEPLMNTMKELRKMAASITSSGNLDLFSDKTLSSRFANLAKQHLRGVENVYTQHYPAFARVIERAAKGRLPVEDYPFASADSRADFGAARVAGGAASTVSGQGSAAAQNAGAHQRGAKLIIAFIIGGTTYEEAKAVSELNDEGQVKVYLVRSLACTRSGNSKCRLLVFFHSLALSLPRPAAFLHSPLLREVRA